MYYFSIFIYLSTNLDKSYLLLFFVFYVLSLMKRQLLIA